MSFSAVNPDYVIRIDWANNTRWERPEFGPPPPPAPPPPLRPEDTTIWTYDANGNLLTEKLPDGSQRTVTYDSMNRPTTVTNAGGQVTTSTYDGGDNLLSLTDARGNISTFEYDKRDLCLKKTYPDGSMERWTYDPARNPASFRTRGGKKVTFRHNQRNRLTKANWNDATPDITWSYDAVGRLKTVKNTQAEVTFAYDAAGQLVRETQSLPASSLTRSVTSTYNADGLRSSLTYPDSKMFSFTYTERNQLAEIGLNLLALNPLVRYDYDLAGRRTRRALNNQSETTYGYDPAGRLTSVEQTNAGGVFDRRDYGYNAVSNRTWEKRDGLLGDAYAYDPTQQITGVQYDAETPEGTPGNPLAQLTLTYDSVGNRETVTRTTGTNAPVVATYTANALNQYTQIVSSGSSFPLTADANGNLVTGEGLTCAYDSQNRLISVISGTHAVTLAYDGLNRVVTRTVNGAVTHFVYDTDWNVIEEYDGNGVQLAVMAYGAEIDEPIFRWDASSNLTYYHQDALGNVTTLTDTSGIPVESYRYDIFGKPIIYDPYLNVRTASFFGNPYLFTGREYLAEVGLYNSRNRVYSPELGRFLQTDPIGFAAGDENLYRYVSNNPVNAVDPLGLETEIYIHRNAPAAGEPARNASGTMSVFHDGQFQFSTPVNQYGYQEGSNGIYPGTYSVLPRTDADATSRYPNGTPAVTAPGQTNPGNAGNGYRNVYIHPEANMAGGDSRGCPTVSAGAAQRIRDFMDADQRRGENTTLHIFNYGGAPLGVPNR